MLTFLREWRHAAVPSASRPRKRSLTVLSPGGPVVEVVQFDLGAFDGTRIAAVTRGVGIQTVDLGVFLEAGVELGIVWLFARMP